MNLKPKYINIILNLLLGAAWAAVLYGFFFGFFSTHANFFIKFISGMIHGVFGLFLVLLVEALYRYFLNHEILKEQLNILKKLEEKID